MAKQSSTTSSGAQILKVPAPTSIRQELEDLVLADLLGPAGGATEEVDESRVSERYLVGMLAPARLQIIPEEHENVAVETGGDIEDGPSEGKETPPKSLFPSSLGLSFCVPAGVKQLKVTAAWGKYERADSESIETPEGKAKKVWKRTQVTNTGLLPIQEGKIGPWAPSADQSEVVVRGQARKLGDDLVVSLFLVNGQEEPDRLRDQSWLFQPELTVEHPDGKPVFQQRGFGPGGPQKDAEDLAMDMIYRDQVEFAVGHGVGVSWELDPTDPRRANRLMTRVVPSHEVPRQDVRGVGDDQNLQGLVLDMRELAETPDAELGKKLRPLADAYEKWIAKERTRIQSADLAPFKDAAENAALAWEKALKRIREGLALVEQDPQAAEAFRFANRAMWLQRIHTRLTERKRRGEQVAIEEIDKPENRTWYPFQLGFMLLNLAGITRLDHPDRSDAQQAVADLLWFPTGGGKTEAYLGLAAYTLAMRRLQGEVEGRTGEHGIAVLMRYTLRLLTIQQFQRACALICACEEIRRTALKDKDLRWGQEPFRIGLWVGQKTTPNWTADAAEALKQHHKGQYHASSSAAGVGSPAQLTYCPWCGAKIEPGQDVRVESFEKGAGRTFTFCNDPGCPFSRKLSPEEGLPILVVDEEIYRRLPAFLIATVDKFAQMPWNGITANLFGQVSGYCPRHGFRSPDLKDTDSHPAKDKHPAVKSVERGPIRPPDLIIQDELHLISGPLGTLTGLYETAIDRLCTWQVAGKDVRPKIIASTATIRRAGDQIHGLFLRRVEVFPPHGLDAADNFFSIQRPISHSPGRRYLGICAQGRRLKAAIIRVYVAFLGAGQTLFEKYGKTADPWMTLVGYFNSIRELAGTRRLSDDDVASKLQFVERRGLSKRRRPELRELTSRVAHSDIPILLDQLEVVFEPTTGKPSKVDYSKRPLDILLATNMISVGVDVSRLGLMVVDGQPKTTAEYIQATSRIGRRYPGLVCTIYNWARPRDLSHFETFGHYHATFYKHVEALSVTPFADRALDRGLAGLLVGLVRLMGLDFNGNDKAEVIEIHHALVEEAVQSIARRAARVMGSKQAGKDVEARLKGLLDRWRSQADQLTGGAKLGYKARKDGVTRPLLKSPSRAGWEDFTCLNSLREVEPTVKLVLDEAGMDSGAAPVAEEG